MAMSDRHCADCGLDLDIVGERFEVRPEIRAAVDAWPLCVACVEDRLHRRLTSTDLAGDTGLFRRQGRSPRMLKRIWGERRWRGRTIANQINPALRDCSR